ncbi:NAD(P)H-hydrate dehydratase [Synechococcales cyanobacterium C]|uniref:Bifunctional NAD(P)H-hydrate repair enzyme n=1 Tax=Petrachloros mirabilis ULC683 TaxID=2781853 RepID=A0A8K2A7Y9_9CYAN|nr:NAD(P)H-hydrate dehydratase [Petrachloros mirabilis]NCJ07429.1 NAD(P)H-hydrate dehydratase [Petrachloros mirabilis ULC683]
MDGSTALHTIATTQLKLDTVVVTAAQMQAIESRLFAAGMPVAALMEKVAGLVADWVQARYPLADNARIGVLVGPGHNGGDALVVARELWLNGYEVQVYQPFEQVKELTQHHGQYACHLGIPSVMQVSDLAHCHVLIDGLFGFGLTRDLSGAVAEGVAQINQGSQPVVSIDVPSGLHTDTGEVLGVALRATQTLCLGLWKLGLLQEQALPYVGQVERIDFGIPEADVMAVLGQSPACQRITTRAAMAAGRSLTIAALPLSRPINTHKYRQGHLLMVGGSQTYSGSILLAALGAKATGVGMLSVAVPESLKPGLVAQIPDALVIGCPETQQGAIARLPDGFDLRHFQAIAYGPGVTCETDAVLHQLWHCECPLVLDADGLNLLAQLGTVPQLQKRQSATILTPHLGEFKGLFPAVSAPCHTGLAQIAAQQSGAWVLLKGARTVVANPEGRVWINPESTPALARGGSGDVLTGVLGGTLAQFSEADLSAPVCSAVWWHAQAGIWAAQQRTVMGVDALTLAHSLIPALTHWQA